MPFYQYIAPADTLSTAQKEELVAGITKIHCEATGAPALFVQIEFQEVAPGDMYQNGKPSSAVRLHARIRAGRDAETKLGMLTAYTNLICEVAKVPVSQVMVAFVETKYENVMEAGVRLPAPGEEEEWLAKFLAPFEAEANEFLTRGRS